MSSPSLSPVSATDSMIAVPSRFKRQASAAARAALQGIVLNAIQADDGRPLYVASIQALTRCFDDLGKVEAWLDQVEGKA